MKKINLLFRFSILLLLAVVTLFSQGCNPATNPSRPRPIGDDEEELKKNKKAYMELIHRAAPGVNWRQIEEQNDINNQYRLNSPASRTTATFAGGALTGFWYERGNTNLAGRMNEFAYVPTTSTLYALADGGSIWRTTLPTASWIKVSDKVKFRTNVLAAMQRGSTGSRVFVSSGLKVWRTDNNGATFDTTATGITFPVAWGGNYIYKIIPVNDGAGTVYCVTFGWDAVSWMPSFSLYSSLDSGVSFTFIRKFPYRNDNQLSFCNPLGSPHLYALGVTSSAADTLYRITASTVSVLSSISSIDASDNLVRMKCMERGGTTHFYAITGGAHVYHSTNFGSHWLLKSTLSTDNGMILGLSAENPNVLLRGNVEAYRSVDSGATWTLVNTWGSYYGAMATNLHADMRDFSFFRYSSGVQFGVIANDGGVYTTNDEVATVSNISLTGLRVNQLWDHITDPTDSNIVFGGSQDQGLQTTNAVGGTGMVTETQIISGDYGQLRITGGGNTLWALYPGGDLKLYKTLSSPTFLGNWNMSGTQKPNAGWMLATSDYYTSSTQNVILIGGGELSGGPGSYLSRLTLSTTGFTITPYQYSYDFRANSNSGTSGISAIGISPLSTNNMYVAAEDGTFFYSTNAGTTWAKTLSFSGTAGFWLYGSSIVASPDTVDKVYFAGSGYSSPPVYVSRDHGQTFTDMSAGLPRTLVYRLAAYQNDSFLFAATDAGPYVYVQATNSWYSLADATTPGVEWRSVEYIPATRTVRFGTYGRGIWDLRLVAPFVTTGILAAPAPEMTIAPNPLTNGQQLKILSAVDQEINVEVRNLWGQLVWSGRSTTNTNLDLKDLVPGVYICTATAAGKQVKVTLVVN